jgi:Flp pilus assembly pilin Flp
MWLWKRLRADERGQASVEYAAVLLALLSIVIGLAALWRFGESGGFVELARESSSHLVSASDILADLQDATLF